MNEKKKKFPIIRREIEKVLEAKVPLLILLNDIYNGVTGDVKRT